MDKGHTRTWPWSLAQLEDELSFTEGGSVTGKMVMWQDKRKQGNSSNELMDQAECGAKQGSAVFGERCNVVAWKPQHNMIKPISH
jgi:hypothetical protein